MYRLFIPLIGGSLYLLSSFGGSDGSGVVVTYTSQPPATVIIVTPQPPAIFTLTIPQIQKEKVPAVEVPTEDPRVAALDRFFLGHTLAPYSSEFVSVADEYGLDWRVLPAMSLRESSAGDYPPAARKFNPFGYDNGDAVFSSWEEAIQTAASDLHSGRHYVNVPDLGDKLCVWQSGQLCYATSSGPEYRDKIMSTMWEIG